MLLDLVNTTAAVSRTSTVSGKQVYASVASGIACRIEPASDYVASVNDVQSGQAFRVFFDAAQDVRVNDKLTIDSIVYEVRGVKPVTGRSSALSHKEVLAVRPLKQ